MTGISAPSITVLVWPNGGRPNWRVLCSKWSSAAAAQRPSGVGRQGLPGRSSSDSVPAAAARIGASEAICHSCNWYSIGVLRRHGPNPGGLCLT